MYVFPERQSDEVFEPDRLTDGKRLVSDALTTLPVPVKTVDSPDEAPDRDLFRHEIPPLARFRMFPKKPFSVSDFTSGGAWCELQYYYTLTRLPGGRKTRTAEMKAGSKVHKKLEDEVHTTVKIDIVSKEDIFGLKLWNVIQGLRTLRDTGLTREMEVWGMVDGHLVTGIIDSLSYTCPNAEFEEEILSSQESRRGDGKAKHSKKKPRTIYLADVKTRGSRKPPKSAAMLRPTKVQLFLYHRFLSAMIAGKLDFFRVLRRLDIDADDPFSDEFIAQVGSLHDEVFYDADADAADGSSADGDSSPDLIKYRCIRELLDLLREELRLTFSDGTASLGQLVSVDYRHREDGSIIGTNTFPVDDDALSQHLASDLEWWKGERMPRGVDIEEAFKCGFCEFAAGCEWRIRMEEERLQRAREKVAAAGGYH